MDEDYKMVYGIDKLAKLLAERGIEFCVNDEASLLFTDASGNPHECWMAGAEENLVNVMIAVTPEQATSVPDLNGIIAENAKLRAERDYLLANSNPTATELRRVRSAWKKDRDENAKLREQVVQLKNDCESERDYADQMEANEKRAVSENAKLRVENVKLRELVRKYGEYTDQDRCEGCVYKTRCNDGLIDECWQMIEIRKLLKEIGDGE